MAQGLTCPNWWERALVHLEQDPELAPIIAHCRAQNIALSKCDNLFHAIVRAILGQQVSTKQAQNLTKKFWQVWHLSGVDSLEHFLSSQSTEELKHLGVSTTKARALKEISSAFCDSSLSEEKLSKMTDEEILQTLTAFHGIGPWTVTMILIFGLNRPNVFAGKDLGVRLSFESLYGNSTDVTEKTNKWAPYLTAATWLLWLNRSGKPVQY